MADDPHVASPKSEPIDPEGSKEDADTAAAREELKQTVISDKPPAEEISTSGAGADVADEALRASTPGSELPEAQEDDLREQVSSPKKKRAHDEVDKGKDVEETDARSVASSDSAKDRALRSEPEKKRHRDEVTEPGKISEEAEPVHPAERAKSPESGLDTVKTTTGAETVADKGEKAPSTTTAFASSGFAKLASSSASPFGSLAATSKGSGFGSFTTTASPFGTLATPKPSNSAAAPTLSFKSTGPAAAGASPFASMNATGAKGFGSTFGGGFGSALSGKPLGSFAQPGGSFKSEKPARPFGAPESDAEDESEEGDGEGEDDSSSDGAEKEDTDKEDSKAVDEKKRARLQRIVVNDGEAGEVTILAVRAKMFYLEKEVGWKERGAGMLKINVPESCIQFDEAGAPIPGSFDASGMEEEEGTNEEAGLFGGHKVARLILRQDHTHRVLLNTAILPAMKFQEKTSLKAVGVLFTAFQGDEAKPVSVHMRMSAASAKSFTNEVGMIQRELQNS